jgi:hypothetical protein
VANSPRAAYLYGGTTILRPPTPGPGVTAVAVTGASLAVSVATAAPFVAAPRGAARRERGLGVTAGVLYGAADAATKAATASPGRGLLAVARSPGARA